jgi:hypothetical protein
VGSGELRQAVLADRGLAGVDFRDGGLINVDVDDIVIKFGETRSDGGTDVAAANDGDVY